MYATTNHIILASAQPHINALNRLYAAKTKLEEAASQLSLQINKLPLILGWCVTLRDNTTIWDLIFLLISKHQLISYFRFRLNSVDLPIIVVETVVSVNFDSCREIVSPSWVM